MRIFELVPKKDAKKDAELVTFACEKTGETDTITKEEFECTFRVRRTNNNNNNQPAPADGSSVEDSIASLSPKK